MLRITGWENTCSVDRYDRSLRELHLSWTTSRGGLTAVRLSQNPNVIGKLFAIIVHKTDSEIYYYKYIIYYS